VPARVVWGAEDAGGDWLVGCEFAEQLGAEELKALL
jgi:hypothetical protein